MALPEIIRHVFDEAPEEFTIQYDTDPPTGVNLTGKTVYIAIRTAEPDSSGQPSAVKVLSQSTHVDAANGVTSIFIPLSWTETAGAYKYDLSISDTVSSPNTRISLGVGDFTVDPSIRPQS
jgi:hypothetical protein